MSVSVRSTNGFGASVHRYREPGLAVQLAAYKEEEQTEPVLTAMGSIVLGWSILGLEPLTVRARFRSA